MRLPWLVPSLIALALGFFSSRSVRAESETSSSTAVLGLEPIDVPTNLADDISEQLRQRVSNARDMHLVSGRDLVEVKLVFGCADEAVSCMAQAGKSLDAQKLLYGSVKRSGDDYVVWLKMFDVRRSRIESFLNETLSRKNADAAGIKAASARWFAKLTGRTVSTGTLQLSANMDGATISMDGVPMGITTAVDEPLVMSDVAPGKHELVVAKSGHVPVKQQVTVAAGQSVAVQVTLRAITAAPEPAHTIAAPPVTESTVGEQMTSRSRHDAERDAEVDDGRGGYRKSFWVTLVAGLASAGGAIKFGLDVSDVNKQLDPYRRFPCMGNQLCDNKGVVRPALTVAEKSKVSSLNDQGNRDQTLQWVCVGVGSALGVASGYLLYKGYIDSDQESAHRQARHGLRIYPTAGVSSTGILAEFEF